MPVLVNCVGTLMVPLNQSQDEELGERSLVSSSRLTITLSSAKRMTMGYQQEVAYTLSAFKENCSEDEKVFELILNDLDRYMVLSEFRHEIRTKTGRNVTINYCEGKQFDLFYPVLKGVLESLGKFDPDRDEIISRGQSRLKQSIIVRTYSEPAICWNGSDRRGNIYLQNSGEYTRLVSNPELSSLRTVPRVRSFSLKNLRQSRKLFSHQFRDSADSYTLPNPRCDAIPEALDSLSDEDHTYLSMVPSVTSSETNSLINEYALIMGNDVLIEPSDDVHNKSVITNDATTSDVTTSDVTDDAIIRIQRIGQSQPHGQQQLSHVENEQSHKPNGKTPLSISRCEPRPNQIHVHIHTPEMGGAYGVTIPQVVLNVHSPTCSTTTSNSSSNENSGTWKCDICTVINPREQTICLVCESWMCNFCSIRNVYEARKCLGCDVAKGFRSKSNRSQNNKLTV